MNRRREQAGQIFQRHGSWFVRYYENRVVDEKVKRVRVCKRLGEATRKAKNPPAFISDRAREVLASANRPNLAPENVLRVGDFVERVYFPRIEQRVRPSTLKCYRDIWNMHLKPRCSGAWMKDVRTYHVQQWLDDIAHPGLLSRRSLQHIKTSLSGIFKLAKQQGFFVGENPVRDSAVAASAREPQQTRVYTLEEINLLLTLLPEPAATIFAVAAFTGLRRGEISGLRWEDFRNGEIHVSQSVWEGHITQPKTPLSRGAVPVIAPLAVRLKAHRQRCGTATSGIVFTSQNGKPLNLNNVLGRQITPALEKAELKHLWKGWHAARRGLATNLYALGVAEKTIQAILRHSNVNTTSTYYIKTAPADAVAAMGRFEASIPQVGNDWATPAGFAKPSGAVN